MPFSECVALEGQPVPAGRNAATFDLGSEKHRGGGRDAGHPAPLTPDVPTLEFACNLPRGRGQLSVVEILARRLRERHQIPYVGLGVASWHSLVVGVELFVR